LPEAHCALAGILKIYEWDWQGAERAYEQALRLDPKNWQAHRGYAALLAARGRTNAAMREIQSAHELDPLSLSLSMEIAWNLYIARRYDDAIRQAARTLEMEPQFFPAQHALGLAYEETGRYEEARIALERAASGSGNPTATAALARVSALMGDMEAARRLLAELLALHHRSYVLPYLPALVYAGLAEYEEALTWLERACDDRDPYLVWIGMDPRLDRLRDHPRFRNLLERIERGAARTAGENLERGSAASGK
jgi:tetratricopeptide (TPR) repeat protein